MSNLSGLYPPITIPFAEDESIDFDHLEANLALWAQQPLSGLVIPGSNSEAVFLSDAERIEVWQACSRALRGSGRNFIAGTGVETTAGTITLTCKAAELGAGAALVIPPFFYKAALNDEVLYAHYRDLAQASPIPILIYNVPAFTGIDFSPALILRIAELPRVIGMKDSSANVVKIASILSARPDFLVFAGTGSAMLPFLALGSAGTIAALANFAATLMHQVESAFNAGDMQTARRIQLSLADINSVVTARFGVAGLKYTMDRTGYFGGWPRRPLRPLKPEIKREIDQMLEKLGLLKA